MNGKKVAYIIGLIVGVVIIIVGFSVQDTYTYAIGENIKFGGDFYTEMYDVTKDVGRAINYAINDLIRAVGWLIVCVGAVDVCYFLTKLCKEEPRQQLAMKEPAVYDKGEEIVRPHQPVIQEAERGTPAPQITDGWKCSCGKMHPRYETSCVICGKTKFDVIKEQQDRSGS